MSTSTATITSLESLITLQRGFDLPSQSRKEGSVPVVASSGTIGWHNESKVTAPGVVIGRSGSIGGGQYVSQDFWPLNTTLWVKDFKGNDPRFIYYLLRSINFTSFNAGAGVPTLNRNHIASLKAPSFPLKIQQRIASVLSSYDDLIENNRRRIALLEEAARLLYREWFVHFRFPGHEHVKIVDGVPEGWKQSTIGKHCPLIYGKALKAETRIQGDIDVYGSSGIVGAHNKRLVTGPAIVVGRKGNVGSIFWTRRDFWPIDTVYYVAPENSDFYTYYALQHVTFISTDVAVPGLNRDFAHSRKLLLPTDALLQGFNAQVEPIQAQTGLLERQVIELGKARDLLLPRLMDGRLEV